MMIDFIVHWAQDLEDKWVNTLYAERIEDGRAVLLAAHTNKENTDELAKDLIKLLVEAEEAYESN